MEMVEIISRKIQRLIQEFANLKKDNMALQSEIELLREQVKKHQPASIENEKYERERERLRIRLERMGKKLDKLASNAASSATVFSGDLE